MKHSLSQLSLVDGDAQKSFDRYTRMATQILGVPVSLVSIVEPERDRQFFTSSCGLGEPWVSRRQTPLSHSFCKHVKADGKPLVVEDARDHPLVKDNLAIPDLNVISYLGMPVFASDGTPLGAFCAIDGQPRKWTERDMAIMDDLSATVSEQIAMREMVLSHDEARKAVSRFGRIVENARHEVFTFNSSTFKFQDVNEGARRNLGYEMLELRQLTPTDIKPEFSAKRFAEHVEPLKSGEVKQLEFETVHQRKDGSLYPVFIRLELHKDADENMFVAFCEDISERRAIAEQLREKTEDFAALFNNASDPMLIADGDTKIKIANPAYERMLECAPDELSGMRICDITPPEYRDELVHEMANASPEAPSFSLLRAITLKGQPSVMMSSNHVQYKDNKPSKVFTIARDVTEIYQAKTDAEKLAKETQEALNIRNVFIATMSHEVRTPINAIMGLLELIERAEIPERQRRQARAAHSSAEALLAQLTNVLEVSKLEAKSIELTYDKVTIGELAEDLRAQLQGVVKRSKKDLSTPVHLNADADFELKVEKRRILQITANLIDNASRFTNEGSIEVSIDVLSKTAPPMLSITVKDTGIGIGLEHQERIFDRFAQIENPLTRTQGGAGLGLTISRGLAELLHGQLIVESCIGSGSAFTLSIPVQSENCRGYK